MRFDELVKARILRKLRASMICLQKIDASGSFISHVEKLLSRVRSSPISSANGARRTCVIEVSDHPIARNR